MKTIINLIPLKQRKCTYDSDLDDSYRPKTKGLFKIPQDSSKNSNPTFSESRRSSSRRKKLSMHWLEKNPNKINKKKF